jgi:hypothetical protein
MGAICHLIRFDEAAVVSLLARYLWGHNFAHGPFLYDRRF